MINFIEQNFSYKVSSPKLMVTIYDGIGVLTIIPDGENNEILEYQIGHR